MSIVLKAFGASVAAVNSAMEGLAHLARERPDCVVSDISMPDRDGLWFIRQVRAQEKQARIPAVAVTACVGADNDGSSSRPVSTRTSQSRWTLTSSWM